jgi:hypothetical protein
MEIISLLPCLLSIRIALFTETNNKKPMTLLRLILIGGILSSQLTFGQTLLNGDMETWPSDCIVNTAPTSWVNFTAGTPGLGPDDAGVCAGTTPAFDGDSYSNLVWSTSFWEGMSFTFTDLTPGVSYDLSFQGRNSNGTWASTGSIYIDVYHNGVVIFTTAELFAPDTWNLYTVNFTAISATDVIAFQVVNGSSGTSGSAGIDAVAITSSCSPTTSSFNETVCDSYTVPSGDETYTSSGIYNDTIPNSGGCDSVMTIDLTINTVDVGTVLSGLTIMANESGASYQWIDCSDSSVVVGATSQSFTPTADGDYAVIVDNGCLDTSACVNIHGVGILKNKEATYRIYPNPIDKQLIVSFSDQTIPSELTLRDVSGKELQSANLKGGALEIEFDVSLLKSGIYFLEIEYDGKTLTKKLFKL